MNKYLAKKQQEQKAQRPCGAIRASASASARSSQESIEHIQVGSFYEIDCSKLPHPTTPEQLQLIRVVMVSEKTLFNVSVRFPSLHSLKTHLNEESYENPDGGSRKQLPELDEMYSMSPAIASEVLCRRLQRQEIAEQSKTRSFWAVRRRSANPKSPSSPRLGSGAMSPSPYCLSSVIKLSGMVQWGNRKQHPFLTRRRHESPSSFGTDEEGKQEIEEEDDKAQEESPYELRKRKRPQKKPKIEKRPKQNTRNKQKLVEASRGRWPASRYQSGEEHMLNVMKAQGVSAENPILRASLKSEARKFIKDTGLIDHLLTHMAGKLAPGGADRFRGKYNADGALEYWLESASIRKDAGVEDPSWTPPPGRKSGDDPTQHPTCSRMFQKILEAIANLERERGFKQQEDLAIVTTSNQGQANSSVIREDKDTELAVKVSGIQKQLLQQFQYISAMEEQMKSLLASVSTSPKGVVQQTDSLLVPTPLSVLNTPNKLNPGSPLKPLPDQSQIDSISDGKTRDIDLNEFPDDIDSTAMME